MSKKFRILLLLILLVGVFLRFYQLGYSHFYGDETKAIYYQKDVSAIDHFFNQRKGPGQFLVAWTIENLTSSYNELFMRAPFAVVGVVSIALLFFVVAKLFDQKAALIATTIFSLHGFYIAFSRTVQYQSFYIFFGLLSLHFYLYSKGNVKNYLLSGISLGIAFLFHYDSLFFLVPLFALISSDYKNKNLSSKNILQVISPIIFITGLYYLPYLIKGAFLTDTLPYLLKRRTGEELRPSSTIYTFLIYNPLYILLFFNIFSVFSLLSKNKKSLYVIFIWFLIPFILFELIFSSSGTHIHNYFLPLIILSSVGVTNIYERLSSALKPIFIAFLVFLCAFVLIIQTSIYIPKFNTGYPWKDVTLFGNRLNKIDQSMQVFVYGFPYYRAWDQIVTYLDYEDDGRFFVSNENDTIAEFYMKRFKRFDGRATQNYIHIFDNQLDKTEIDIRFLDTNAYVPIKDFYHNGEKVATIYGRLSLNRH